MEKFAIFGAGGHGAVVADILESCNASFIVVDDNPKGKQLSGMAAISKQEFLGLGYAKEFGVILAVGDSRARKNLYEFFCALGFCLPSVIHSSAKISKSARIADAVVVMPNAVVNARAEVHTGVILNSSSVVEHDCRISAFAHIAPNATLCGNVFIGENTHIGAGSVVIEGKSIGKNCLVGAGSVVIRDIQEQSRVVGNPARNL